MHLGSLPGILLALAWGLLGTAPGHNANIAGNTVGANSIALYSIVAQAETPTVETGTTTITPTATLEITGTAASTITPTGTISVTGTITSGGTLTPTVEAPTVIPLPTAVPQQIQPSLQINPFDWNFLTSAPTDPTPKLGPFAWIFLVLMLVLVGGGIYGYRVLRPRWKNTNTVWYKAVARFGQPALWIGVLGLVFLFFRLVELDFFNKRLWLYLDGGALLGLIVWFFYWYRNSYPQEIAKFQKTQKAKQYMPSGTKGPVRSTTGPSSPVAQKRGSKNRRKK